MTRPILGSLELLETAFSGFAYPARGHVVRDLNGGAVLQLGALTLRQASIAWVAPSTAEKDTAHGYFDAIQQVPFTDREGVNRTVVVLAFSSAVSGAYHGAYDCRATLVELEVNATPSSLILVTADGDPLVTPDGDQLVVAA